MSLSTQDRHISLRNCRIGLARQQFLFKGCYPHIQFNQLVWLLATMNHNHLPAWNASLMSNTGSPRSTSWATDEGTAQPPHVPQQAAVTSHKDASQPIFLPLPNSHQTTSSMSEVPSIDFSLLPASASSKKLKCPYCITEFTHLHDFDRHVILHSLEEPYGCAEAQVHFHALVESTHDNSLHTRESHDPLARPRRLESGISLAKSRRTGSKETLPPFLKDPTLQGEEIETRLSSKQTKKSSGATAGLACPFPSTKSSCQVIHNYFSHVW